MFRKFRRIFSIILLLISISSFIWASLPNQRRAEVQSISASEVQWPTYKQAKFPFTMENRQVRIEWPERMRIGEHEVITLVFEPSMDGATNYLQNEYSDIYDSYNLMAEATFEVSGIGVSPANPTRESMPSGEPVKFIWQLSTDRVGFYEGSVWLFLRFLPLDGGQASQTPIYIRDVNIQTSSLFGLNETEAYFLGGVGFILSVSVVFDDMIGLLHKRMRKTAVKAIERTKDI